MKKTQTARWSTEMVRDLIKCLQNYKTMLSYKGCDFDADRPLQYREIRKSMANLYEEVNIAFFGPPEVSVSETPIQELSKEEFECYQKRRRHENDLIAKGHGRIHQKIKEIRQNFAKAVTSGTRSGSGRLVLEFYDELVMIWGGSPASEPLHFGVDTNSFAEKTEECIFATDDESLDQTKDVDEMSCNKAAEEGYYRDESVSTKPSLKRAATPNNVSRLIDNKRKHLERKLSATQRDCILINEAKEDKEMKKELANIMRESKNSFKEALDGMSGAMNQLAQGFTRSMEMLTQALLVGQQPINQNLFYQNSASQCGPHNPQPHFQQTQEYQFSPRSYSNSQKTFTTLMRDAIDEENEDCF